MNKQLVFQFFGPAFFIFGLGDLLARRWLSGVPLFLTGIWIGYLFVFLGGIGRAGYGDWLGIGPTLNLFAVYFFMWSVNNILITFHFFSKGPRVIPNYSRRPSAIVLYTAAFVLPLGLFYIFFLVAMNLPFYFIAFYWTAASFMILLGPGLLWIRHERRRSRRVRPKLQSLIINIFGPILGIVGGAQWKAKSFCRAAYLGIPGLFLFVVIWAASNEELFSLIIAKSFTESWFYAETIMFQRLVWPIKAYLLVWSLSLVDLFPPAAMAIARNPDDEKPPRRPKPGLLIPASSQ